MAQAATQKPQTRAEVVSVMRGTSIQEVSEIMHDEDVGSVVVQHDGEAAGIVTDRDITLALRENPDASELTAEDVMTEEVVTIEEGTDVFHIIQTLDREGVRRAPIVDSEGEVTGFVSLDDILVLLGHEIGDVADLVETQT